MRKRLENRALDGGNPFVDSLELIGLLLGQCLIEFISNILEFFWIEYGRRLGKRPQRSPLNSKPVLNTFELADLLKSTQRIDDWVV